MQRYFFNRVLLLLPTLFVALVLTFGLSRLVPGDPVEQLDEDELEQSSQKEAALLRTYRRKAARLGLDKPVFYFSIQPAAYPDTLDKIPFRHRRETQLALLRQSGNWPAVEQYFSKISSLKAALQAMPTSTTRSTARSRFARELSDLQFTVDFSVAQAQLRTMGVMILQDSVLQQGLGKAFKQLNQSFNHLLAHPQYLKLYLPTLVWHGFSNQFQQALLGYFQADLGMSYNDGKPVSAKIGRALVWTCLLNIFALPIAYILAIFLGVRMAVRKGTRFDRRANAVLFGLYALPSFWVALILLVVFSNPDWGLNFLTITGMMDLNEDTAWGEWLVVGARQLIVPIVCLIYPAMTVLARQMRSAMIVALNQDFIRTARAKGLPEKEVIWKHAFPNAAFPLITYFGSLLPEMIAGSVLVENIFNIPGMGRLLIYAMGTQDWPTVFGIMIMGALLSIVGLLFADLAYAWLDPRVRFGQESSPIAPV